MNEVSRSQAITRIGPLQIGILLLTLATAFIHLSRALLLPLVIIGHSGLRLFPALFYLNAIGYVVLLVALYLPQLWRFQRAIRWTLIGYAALTILLWFLITHASPALLAYIDKPIEFALIILLLIEDRQARLQRV